MWQATPLLLAVLASPDCDRAAYPVCGMMPVSQVIVGLGRIVALCYRSSTSYYSHEHIRHLYFSTDNATEP
jgi:hypothetical protein